MTCADCGREIHLGAHAMVFGCQACKVARLCDDCAAQDMVTNPAAQISMRQESRLWQGRQGHTISIEVPGGHRLRCRACKAKGPPGEPGGPGEPVRL